MTAADLNIQLRVDDDALRVWSHDGTSGDLIVAFSGIGPSPKKLPGYEFAATATGNGRNDALFIADPNRSWLNHPGLIERIAEYIRTEVDRKAPRRIMAIGHSMGGFAAMVLPAFVRFDTVLALSPQVSVHPELVPDESRWLEHRSGIDSFKVRSFLDHIVPTTSYVTVFGALGADRIQRRLLKCPNNILNVLMPRTHHNTAAKLRNQGTLSALVELVQKGRIRRAKQLLADRHGASSFRGAPKEMA